MKSYVNRIIAMVYCAYNLKYIGSLYKCILFAIETRKTTFLVDTLIFTIWKTSLLDVQFSLGKKTYCIVY